MNKTHDIENITMMTATLMSKLPYHNFNHALDVYTAVQTLGTMENVSKEEMFILENGALLHDIIMIPARVDNEEKSAEFAQRYLPILKYPQKYIEKVSKLILATKMPTKPNTLLEKIICDADTDNLGREDFFYKGEQVREELGVTDMKKWYENQIKFLEGHRYYTESAKTLRDATKQKNIEKIYDILSNFDKI